MEFYKRENNNFNLIRMIAAYAVIYSHSYAIQSGTGEDIIVKISKITSAGQMAVFVYVFLSGVYLYVSLSHTESLWQFGFRRIMRIYPLLILTLLLSLGMGAIFTSLPVAEYVKDRRTWYYFAANATGVFNAYDLPGVFENHNNPAINGVLWYIPFIVRLYLAGGVLYSIGMLKTRERANITFLVLLIWILVAPDSVPLLGSNDLLYGSPVFPQYAVTAVLACLLAINHPDFRVQWYVPLLLLMFCLLQKDNTYENTRFLWACLAILSALCLGCSNAVRKIKVMDCSFEVFLFGWPIAQVICELIPDLSPIGSTVLAILISTLWGALLHVTFVKWLNEMVSGRRIPG